MTPEQASKIVNSLSLLNRPAKVACGYQQLTVTGVSPQSLTIPTGATYCEIRVVSATTTGIIMYYTLLGATTPPTTTSGMPLQYMDLFDIDNGDNLANFRVIAVSSTHTLNIQYFK